RTLRAKRELSGDARYLPRFLDQGYCSVGSGGDPAPDQIVQQPRVDGFLRAAAGEPHPPIPGVADQPVGVRSEGMDAEIACRGALDLEERRSSDAGGD